MRKKVLLFAALSLLIAFVFATAVHAATTKYTFNDVEVETDQGTIIVEIEATVKTRKNKDNFVQCTYFSDDYEESLGYYSEHIADDDETPDTAEDVRAFCVDNFENRTQ